VANYRYGKALKNHITQVLVHLMAYWMSCFCFSRFPCLHCCI